MVTKKRLNEIEYALDIGSDELKEIKRLAELGLWAETIGIPAIEHEDSCDNEFCSRLDKALSALPNKK